MGLGENIKKYRKEKHFTQKELAEKLDVTVRTVQNYESGNREPNYKTLKKIAEFLEVPIEYLIESKIKGSFFHNVNKKYYEKMSKKDLEKALMSESKDLNLEEINSLEKDDLINKLYNTNPFIFKIKRCIDNFEQFNKEDFVEFSNEMLFYANNLVDEFMHEEYYPLAERYKEIKKIAYKAVECLEVTEQEVSKMNRIINDDKVFNNIDDSTPVRMTTLIPFLDTNDYPIEKLNDEILEYLYEKIIDLLEFEFYKLEQNNFEIPNKKDK